MDTAYTTFKKSEWGGGQMLRPVGNDEQGAANCWNKVWRRTGRQGAKNRLDHLPVVSILY